MVSIFIFGEESFLVKEKIAFIKENFIIDNPLSGVDFFDFKESNAKNFLELLNSGNSLFSNKKLIIAKNIFFLKGKELSLIFERINGRGAGIDLVLTEDDEKFKLKPKEANKFLTGFKLLEMKKLNPISAKKFIAEKVACFSKGEVTFNDEVLNKLAGVFFNDLWRLNTEIEKLVNFKKKGMVNEIDLKKVVKIDQQAKVFDLIDSIGSGNRRNSFKLAVQLIEDGENELKLFSLIVYQLRNLMRISLGRKKFGSDKNLLGAKLKINPFVVAKTLPMLGLFPEKRLKKAYQLATDLDFKMKTGDLKPRDGLMELILKI